MAEASQKSKSQQTAFFTYVDEHKDVYIERLKEAVSIPSVSADRARRQDCFKMVEKYRAMMEGMGITTELRDLGIQERLGIPLPPVIVGRYGEYDPTKRTICAYSHLDVQPAQKSDGWHTEPFALTEVPATAEDDAAKGYGGLLSGGQLYGRGTTDDKGPALSWLAVLEAYEALEFSIPVNLCFLIECMEESGSEGLDEVVKKEFAPGGFFSNVEAICISDNYWLGTKKPCVQYGLRGIVYFYCEVSGPARDLHSGKFGGVVHEPMSDLFQVMASLTGPKGEILIPGVMEAVAPLTDAESKLYDEIEFDLDSLKGVAGTHDLLHPESSKLAMMHMWRYPSLSLHGIEGAHSGQGAKTVIPAKVIGKFSIRLVAHQDPVKVAELVVAHCQQTFAKLGSPNALKVTATQGAKAFTGDPSDENYQAAFRANEAVYGVKPDFVRSGGSIPVTLTMQDTGRSVVLFPIGRADDGAHGPNEKYDVNQFLGGIKLLGTYLEEFASGGDGTAIPLPPLPVGQRRQTNVRPMWAKRKWGMCGNMAEGQCVCCF